MDRYQVSLSGDFMASWQEGLKEYEGMVYRLLVSEQQIDPITFPRNLENVTILGYLELMKHFALKGYSLEEIESNMHAERI